MLSDKKECYICGSQYGLEQHHIFYGAKDRHKSDKLGLCVWLCYEHHRGTYGVHGTHGKTTNLQLKQEAQRYFEKTHTREEWLSIFHKSYLWD